MHFKGVIFKFVFACGIFSSFSSAVSAQEIPPVRRIVNKCVSALQSLVESLLDVPEEIVVGEHRYRISENDQKNLVPLEAVRISHRLDDSVQDDHAHLRLPYLLVPGSRVWVSLPEKKGAGFYGTIEKAEIGIVSDGTITAFERSASKSVSVSIDDITDIQQLNNLGKPIPLVVTKDSHPWRAEWMKDGSYVFSRKLQYLIEEPGRYRLFLNPDSSLARDFVDLDIDFTDRLRAAEVINNLTGKFIVRTHAHQKVMLDINQVHVEAADLSQGVKSLYRDASRKQHFIAVEQLRSLMTMRAHEEWRVVEQNILETYHQAKEWLLKLSENPVLKLTEQDEISPELLGEMMRVTGDVFQVIRRGESVYLIHSGKKPLILEKEDIVVMTTIVPKSVPYGTRILFEFKPPHYLYGHIDPVKGIDIVDMWGNSEWWGARNQILERRSVALQSTSEYTPSVARKENIIASLAADKKITATYDMVLHSEAMSASSVMDGMKISDARFSLDREASQIHVIDGRGRRISSADGLVRWLSDQSWQEVEAFLRFLQSESLLELRYSDSEKFIKAYSLSLNALKWPGSGALTMGIVRHLDDTDSRTHFTVTGPGKKILLEKEWALGSQEALP